MSRKLRIGVLGGGNILGSHAAGFRKAADLCEVVAVAKANPASVEGVRKALGPDVAIVGDYHEILRRKDIDAVDIILPHDLHLPATVEAAKAGKHVMVEKVMARNVYECDQMIAACDSAGVSLAVTHDRRYQPDWMALKSIVDDGLLGEIRSWKLEHNQDVDLPAGHWIRDYDALGGGAVMSCLTHQIDGLRWYGGEVAAVTCMNKVIPQRMEGETIGVIAARMADGAIAQVAINWCTRSGWGMPNALWSELIHVCGSKGEAYYMCGGKGNATYLMCYDEAAQKAEFAAGRTLAEKAFAPVKPAGKWSGHERCISEWVKMLAGQPAEFSTMGRDSRKTVEVAEAAYLSAETGRTVELPIQPRPWKGKQGR